MTAKIRINILDIQKITQEKLNFVRRIACYCSVRRNVFGDYTSCTDDATVADSNAWQNDGSTAYPTVVADSDGRSCLLGFATLEVVLRMVRSVDLNTGAYQYIASYRYQSTVEESAVEINKGVLTDDDSVAIITEERRTDI